MEGRCSFHGVSVGEAAALDLSGECGGGRDPPLIRRRKDKVGSLGTEEKIHDHSIPLWVISNVCNLMASFEIEMQKDQVISSCFWSNFRS